MNKYEEALSNFMYLSNLTSESNNYKYLQEAIDKANDYDAAKDEVKFVHKANAEIIAENEKLKEEVKSLQRFYDVTKGALEDPNMPLSVAISMIKTMIQLREEKKKEALEYLKEKASKVSGKKFGCVYIDEVVTKEEKKNEKKPDE